MNEANDYRTSGDQSDDYTRCESMRAHLADSGWNARHWSRVSAADSDSVIRRTVERKAGRKARGK